MCTLVRQLRVLACIGLALLAGAACAADGPAASRTLAKLRSSGVITLGHRTTLVPFSFVDAQMQPTGYSVEICRRVVEALRRQPGLEHLETRFLTVTSGTRMALVANGSVDMECGATTNTLERQRKVSFSLTYFVAESRILSKRDDVVDDVESLRGRSVASTIGTTSIQFLHQVNDAQDLKMRILGGLDDVDSFRLLETGQAGAYVMDDSLLRGQLVSARNPKLYAISSQALSVEPYGLTLPFADPTFKRLVDDALRELFVSGELRRIYERWFQRPLPVRGVNLQMPMSAALQRAVVQPTDSASPEHYR